MRFLKASKSVVGEDQELEPELGDAGSDAKHEAFTCFDSATKTHLQGTRSEFGLEGDCSILSKDQLLVQSLQYRKGVLHGQIETFQDGKRVRTQMFKEGLPQGRCKTYSGDDLVSDQGYREGKLDGESLFFLNGRLVKKSHYVRGALEGASEEFSQEGRLLYKETFKGGKSHGIKSLFWPNGNKLSEEEYVRGHPTGHKVEFSIGGKQKADGPLERAVFSRLRKLMGQ